MVGPDARLAAHAIGRLAPAEALPKLEGEAGELRIEVLLAELADYRRHFVEAFADEMRSGAVMSEERTKG
jgi:hypothetical protein